MYFVVLVFNRDKFGVGIDKRIPYSYIIKQLSMASDQLSLVFSALADPTRRAILAALALGPMPVGEIAKPYAMSEPAVIKHLKVLERAGLVETDRKGQMRPRTLNPQPLAEANGWVEQYRQHWEASFDRLDAYLQEIQTGEQE